MFLSSDFTVSKYWWTQKAKARTDSLCNLKDSEGPWMCHVSRPFPDQNTLEGLWRAALGLAPGTLFFFSLTARISLWGCVSGLEVWPSDPADTRSSLVPSYLGDPEQEQCHVENGHKSRSWLTKPHISTTGRAVCHGPVVHCLPWLSSYLNKSVRVGSLFFLERDRGQMRVVFNQAVLMHVCSCLDQAQQPTRSRRLVVPSSLSAHLQRKPLKLRRPKRIQSLVTQMLTLWLPLRAWPLQQHQTKQCA